MPQHLQLGGRRHRLLPCGGLLCEAERTLILADLHLETGSAFARRGVLLPPYDSHATLSRLTATIERHRPRCVISLGDAFHDRHGPALLAPEVRTRLAALVAATDWVWVRGNHDPDPPADLGGRWAIELDWHGIALRHIPGGTGRPEIAGHMHPKARIGGRGQALSRPCFATDGQRLVLPAFGSYAGGLDVLDPAIRSLFGEAFEVWLLGRAAVFRVPQGRLAGSGGRQRAHARGLPLAG